MSVHLLLGPVARPRNCGPSLDIHRILVKTDAARKVLPYPATGLRQSIRTEWTHSGARIGTAKYVDSGSRFKTLGRAKEPEMTVLLIAIAAGVATTTAFGVLLYLDSKQAQQLAREAGRRG